MCLERRIMLTFTLSEFRCSWILSKQGWMSWMFFSFIVSGTHTWVTVHQPHVLIAALGHDVIMPCELRLPSNEKITAPPVLYWLYTTHTDNPRLWIPSDKYMGRVNLVDKNDNSSNKSIALKNIQWADSGKYLCKLSITTKRENSFRRKGNETLLMVYDTMIFNLTNDNGSLLQCEINVTVTGEFGVVLSISHNGTKLQTVASGDAVPGQPYVTLSKTLSLRGSGKYECQLHLNEKLITKSIFHYHLSVTVEVAGGGTNALTAGSTTVSAVVEFPEPWLLYVALLLVPITVLLGLVTALQVQHCLKNDIAERPCV
ncbi:uncharacterized protein LOC113136255 [Mastacembelus armatus]|uniref:uncharacterized protein LOC113136255 n=1 Tax=Mastacembelus armatus TaxID=205130 RepID=UPI000E45BB0D|nr:uncharacterized protein LOC113136255 [Mastacembelus armatus]